VYLCAKYRTAGILQVAAPAMEKLPEGEKSPSFAFKMFVVLIGLDLANT
jgi:hypothetical protein